MRLFLLAITCSAMAACATDAGAGPRIAGTTFGALDTDADGSLSRAEWEGVDLSFTMLDRNTDDMISVEEVERYNTRTSASRTRSRNRSTGSRL